MHATVFEESLVNSLKRSSFRWKWVPSRYCHAKEVRSLLPNASVRPKVSLDSKIENKIERGIWLGSGRIPCIVPPENVTNSINKLINSGSHEAIRENITNYIGTGQKILRSLASRSLPLDARGREAVKSKFQWKIQKMFKKELENIESSDEGSLEDIETQMNEELERRFATSRGNWKPINFDKVCTWSYLLGGPTAFDYAAASLVLRELLQSRQFTPRTHLDFGSGVGTFTWVLQDILKKKGANLEEEFLVDTSSHMNDASRLIREGQEDSIRFSDKGVFYRLHFPGKEEIKYDIVTTASTLSELESTELRLHMVDSLWRRVEIGGFLIMVERGNNAGFQVISEARDYLIKLQEFSGIDSHIKGELVAPCPHTLNCPRYLGDKIPCNFEVKYKNFQIPQLPRALKEIVYKDRFSYLIYQKTSKTYTKWPRIVKEKKCTKNTVTCELCTKEGTLEEVFIHKRDKILYNYTKQVNCGSVYRVNLTPKEEN